MNRVGKTFAMVSVVSALSILAFLGWRQWGPLPDSVAARVNGEAIPAETLNIFVAATRRANPQASRESILKGLIENRLLADMADSEHAHGDETREGSVGYDAQTLHEQQRFRLLRTAYAEEIQAAVSQSGITDSLTWLTAPLALSPEALAPMLTLEQNLYTTMTKAQQAQAAEYVIARYRFAEGEPEQTLSLWDLYRRQNIQLKVQMHNMNLGFIREAIKQQLNMEYVFHWFEHESGTSAAAIVAMDRCIDDARQREVMLHEYGLMHDIHDDNPALRAQADAVTAEQVAEYYQQHQNEFVRVDKVRARHLRVNSQEEADRVVAEIKQGLPFEEAVSRYSVADDAGQGGKLGWVDRESRNDDWIRALAFVQPEGRVSAAFRSPTSNDDAYWEILWVDEKVTGFQPVESESVRYRASMAVARVELQKAFKARLAEASDAASLRVNPELL